VEERGSLRESPGGILLVPRKERRDPPTWETLQLWVQPPLDRGSKKELTLQRVGPEQPGTPTKLWFPRISDR